MADDMDEILYYKSEREKVTYDSFQLGGINRKGISCVWNGTVTYKNTVNFTWMFCWRELQKAGVIRLTGYLLIDHARNRNLDIDARKIYIDWVDGSESIREVMPTEDEPVEVYYELRLFAHYGEPENVDQRKIKEKEIVYTSPRLRAGRDTDRLETIRTKDGILCAWSGQVHPREPRACFLWEFDWTPLKERGVERIRGALTVRHFQRLATREFAIDWVNGTEEIPIEYATELLDVHAVYELKVTAFYAQKEEVVVPGKKLIEYKSDEGTATMETDQLETADKDGISWIWNGQIDPKSPQVNFIWNFDWTKLKKEGVERITGCLNIEHAKGWAYDLASKKVYIDWVNGTEVVKEDMFTEFEEVHVVYGLQLIAHWPDPRDDNTKVYEEMFAASDKTDAVLVVEGKKLHVDKEFLSFHSAFFKAMFSFNFYGGPSEIPIQNVTFADFGLLMSTIYPKAVFPNDRTVEKLLKLADLYQMPTVTGIVEHHLSNESMLSNTTKLSLADAYKMSKLVEKCIRSLDTLEKVKDVEASFEYKKLSLDVKEMLLTRRMEFL